MTTRNPKITEKKSLATIRSHSRIGLLLCIALLSFSCRHENAPSSTHHVTFYVDLLSVDRDSSFTSAPADDISLSQANMTDLWVFEGTTLLAHQVSTDPTFGSPSVELPYGYHSITFIASPQSGQSFNAGNWSSPKAADTFGYVADIDVNSASSNEAIILQRCTYGLRWQSTDIVPSGVAKLRLSVSPMRESLQAGLHAVGGYERVYEYNVTSYIGRVVSVTTYGLPEFVGIEENITSTIDFLDASDNILFTHTRTVPVLTNRRTIISGPLFNSSASSSIRVNSQWLNDYETSL